MEGQSAGAYTFWGGTQKCRMPIAPPGTSAKAFGYRKATQRMPTMYGSVGGDARRL
jgi:hypothetical protein